MSHSRTSRLIFLLFTTVVVALVSACGSGGSAASPAEALASAKTHFDQAEAVDITITTDATASDGDGLLGAEGLLTKQPGFSGEVSFGFMGTAVKVPVVVLEDTVWAKVPLSNQFTEVDLADFDAPNPVDFFDPESGISSLLTALEDVSAGDQTRSGKLILTQYEGTLPALAAHRLLPFDSTADGYHTEVGLTEEYQLNQLHITGDFFDSGTELTYTIEFAYPSEYDPVTAP